MIEGPDFLELELASLRPKPISDELRQRIENRLQPRRFQQPRRAAHPALASCVAAICLLAVVVCGSMNRYSASMSGNRSVRANDARYHAEPTLRSYQLAFCRSPDEFQRLLNQHISLTSTTTSSVVRVGAFTRSEATLATLLGDN